MLVKRQGNVFALFLRLNRGLVSRQYAFAFWRIWPRIAVRYPAWLMESKTPREYKGICWRLIDWSARLYQLYRVRWKVKMRMKSVLKNLNPYTRFNAGLKCYSCLPSNTVGARSPVNIAVLSKSQSLHGLFPNIRFRLVE